MTENSGCWAVDRGIKCDREATEQWLGVMALCVPHREFMEWFAATVEAERADHFRAWMNDPLSETEALSNTDPLPLPSREDIRAVWFRREDDQ